jgi:hypothetical protein
MQLSPWREKFDANIGPARQPQQTRIGTQQTLDSQLSPIPFGKQGITVDGTPINTTPVKASPVDTFKDKLKNNALNRLQSNSNRLNSDLKNYKNLSPNNPKWTQLRQLASQDQQLVQLNQRLDRQISALVVKDRQENSFTSPNTFIDRDDVHPLGVINPQIQAQIKELEGRQALLKIARRQMQSQYPALAVVDSAKVASSSNQELLGSINQGFGQIQGNIGDLKKQIQADPSKALFLDDVVKGTLSGLKIDPNNPNQTQTGKEITDWLKGEQTKHNLVKWGGTLLTGGLTVGAIHHVCHGGCSVTVLFGIGRCSHWTRHGSL